MAARTVTIEVVRRLLRLHLESAPGVVALSGLTGVARGTIIKYLETTEAAGLTQERLTALSDTELGRLVFQRTDSRRERPEPDWAVVHLELKRKHVTKQLLWEEYREQHPDGYEYSRFCELYARWAHCLPPTMRQLHVPGERMFVDFSGGTLPYLDLAGDVKFAKLFLAVLGGSSLTYVEPVADESLPTWVACHVHALEFFGGAARLWVPDNLRAGVTRPDRYEPWLNPVYEQLADHYSASVLPARVRKPRDKAKVEAAVKVASRWIIAALRHQRALSFGLLRDAVRPLTTRLNDRIMRTLGRSRRELFEHSERQALLALPATRYEWTQWARFTVGTDYHVLFEDHAYSVPHRFIGETLDIRATTTTVEILDGRSRVACHARARTVGGKTTLPDHRPVSHQAHAEWTLERVKLSAAAIGPQAALFVDALLQRKAHPEQGLRASLGLVRLAGTYPPARVESACARGLRLRALTLGSIRSILSHGLDREAPGEDRGPLPSHENIRGPDYYK